jgi:site-specific DNA recombinase
MIAALYARKSTDQNVADEEKSVARQIERARAYAADKGWVVADEHVYSDDGISGAEFLKRPGFLALMNALRPGPPFQVLVTMEQSRLGRSQDEVPYALKRITDAGVRIFAYLTNTEIKRESAADKFMIHAIAFVDDMAREQSRERTRDALRRKVERGHVAGGMLYGYRNVRGDGHVTRVIVPDEAEIITRIFREVAAGAGYLKVAQALNSEGLPGPRQRPWAASSIRALVFNPLYRGQIVWSRTRWAYQGGTKRKLDVTDASTWTTAAAPADRIIDETLWHATHDRLAHGRAVYLARTGGKVGGRPTPMAAPKYLLSGMLRCGHCGGSMNAHRHTGRRGESLYYYVCTMERTRGIPCPGDLRVRMEKVNGGVLDWVGERLLSPERVRAAVKAAVARLTSATPDRRPREATLRRELRQIERELARYAEAIARGANFPAVLEAMRARERRRAALEDELAEGAALEQTAAVVDDVALTAELRARCAEWRALLTENPAQAQPILRRLVPERLTLERKLGGVWLTGMATFGPVMARVALYQGMVPPG